MVMAFKANQLLLLYCSVYLGRKELKGRSKYPASHPLLYCNMLHLGCGHEDFKFCNQTQNHVVTNNEITFMRRITLIRRNNFLCWVTKCECQRLASDVCILGNASQSFINNLST